MVALTTAFHHIHLAEDAGELILLQGDRPYPLKHADTRVLIIGGGVTGLTVSLSFPN